jgi:hypothetical protein
MDQMSVPGKKVLNLHCPVQKAPASCIYLHVNELKVESTTFLGLSSHRGQHRYKTFPSLPEVLLTWHLLVNLPDEQILCFL